LKKRKRFSNTVKEKSRQRRKTIPLSDRNDESWRREERMQRKFFGKAGEQYEEMRKTENSKLKCGISKT